MNEKQSYQKSGWCHANVKKNDSKTLKTLISETRICFPGSHVKGLHSNR